MSLSRRLGAILTAAAVLLSPAIASAAVKDAVMNKEGYWGIDVDEDACVASMTLQGGSIFLLRATDGQVTFALFGKTPLARGKVVRLETEAYGFDFRATFFEDRTGLYFDGDLDAQALAALRLARQVRILSDGRQIAAMTFEGTGFNGALDGLTACSKGEKGWWGAGVDAGVADRGAAEDSSTPTLVYDKQEIWGIAVGKHPGICLAQADLGDKRWLQILAADGQLGLGVASEGDRLPRGRKGVIKTDAYSFDFKPKYSNDDHYMSADQAFDSQALFALPRAKWLGVTVDGKELVDAAVGETNFAELLTSVAACSRGEKGWWGEGAPAR
jgi:hypothetical protein